MKKFIAVLMSVIMILSVTGLSCFAGNSAGITAVSPSRTVDFHTSLQARYLKGNYNAVYLYADGTEELSRPEPVDFSWNSSEDYDSYTLTISDDKDFSDALTYTCDTTECEVYNLEKATEYYWKVTGEKSGASAESEVFTFSTTDSGPRNLYIDGITNARDTGGYMTSHGVRTKQGMIFRTARLSENYTNEAIITDAGKDTMLNTLGVRTEIDLRMASTNENGGLGVSALGDSVSYYACPMDYTTNYLSGSEFPDDNQAALRQIFEIASDESNYPIFYHCSIGTDRTGFLTYVFQGLLGVGEEDMLTDYLYSNFGNIGGSRSLSDINDKYLTVFKNYEGDTLSEKIANYLIDIVGIPEEQIYAFIDINLESGSTGNGTAVDGCTHLCHSDNWFLKIIWKIGLFFCRLFKTNEICECGAKHY